MRSLVIAFGVVLLLTAIATATSARADSVGGGYPSAAWVSDAVGDPTGSYDPRGDLVGARTTSDFQLQALLRTYSDPYLDPAYTQWGSTVSWYLDWNQDGTADQRLDLTIEAVNGGFTPHVVLTTLDAVPHPTCQPSGYGVTGALSGGGFGIATSLSCPQEQVMTVGVRTQLTYRTNASDVEVDSAPDSGFIYSHPAATHALAIDASGDPVGGLSSFGDLSTVQASGSELSVFTYGYQDPTTALPWTQYGSHIDWYLDLDHDGVADEQVTFTGGTKPTVTVLDLRAGHVLNCGISEPLWGISNFDTPNTGTGYAVDLAYQCYPSIPRPSMVGVRAVLTYNSDASHSQTDAVPDSGFVYSGEDTSAYIYGVNSKSEWLPSVSYSGAEPRNPGGLFGNPGDRAITLNGNVIYPSGVAYPYWPTGKAVVRSASSGGVTVYRQYRAIDVNAANSPQYVTSFTVGNTGDIAVSGDWNGDGFMTFGLFRPSTGQWFITDDPDYANKPSQSLRMISFGSPGDVPLVGSWNGDGLELPGVFRGGYWYLLTTLHSGNADAVVRYGNPTDIPLPGNWTQTGQTFVGVVRNGVLYETDQFSPSPTTVNTDIAYPGLQYVRVKTLF